MDDGHLGTLSRIRLGGAEILVEFAAFAALTPRIALPGDPIAARFLLVPRGFDVRLCEPAPQVALDLVSLGHGSRGSRATDLGDGENCFPAGESEIVRGREAEAGRGKGSLGPAIVNARHVPVDAVRGSVEVELVADVDEVLYGGNVHVVDRGEVEDDGFEGRAIGLVDCCLATAWAWVIPGAVLKNGLVGKFGTKDFGSKPYTESRVVVRIRAAGFREDGSNHVIEVVIGVGIIVAFRESENVDAGVRRLDIDLWIGSIIMFDRKEDIAHGAVVVV